MSYPYPQLSNTNDLTDFTVISNLAERASAAGAEVQYELGNDYVGKVTKGDKTLTICYEKMAYNKGWVIQGFGVSSPDESKNGNFLPYPEDIEAAIQYVLS